MSLTAPTPVKKALFTEGFLQDPYSLYRRFREEGRIHYVDWGGGAGMWAIFNYLDCASILKDPGLSARRTPATLLTLSEGSRSEFAELVRMLGLWMLFIDPPAHSRIRKLMNKGFSPAVAESLRSQIEMIVDRMLESLDDSSEAELMHSIAHPLPVIVIAEMLGIPEGRHEQLVRWSDAIAMFIGNPRRTVDQARMAQKAVIAVTEYFREVVATRRHQKGSDLISLLLEIEEGGENLTEEELYAQCVMLLLAGHETTRNLIGNGIYSLLKDPEKMTQLRDWPETIRSAVEELLRFESPVQYTHRIVKEEMEVCGVPLRPGEVIAFMLGAANRDPKEFQEPDRLNLTRLNNAHLAFGAGPHFCIGSQLARLEGQVSILRMVQRFPQMRLMAPHPEWTPHFGFRGLSALRVNL